jgi:broad specificity phosphatase PhoE
MLIFLFFVLIPPPCPPTFSVVVVAHLPVLRIILGYLTGKSPEESVQLEIPLNCAICLFPCGYTYTETRFIPVS